MLRNDIKDTLTPQQCAFVNAFCETANPTLSAKKAGYRQQDAKRRAAELLLNPKIAAAINRKVEQNAENYCLCKVFFVKKLLAIIDSTTREEEILDRSGAPTGKKKLNDAGAALRALDALMRCIELNHDDDYALQSRPVTLNCIDNLDDEKI